MRDNLTSHSALRTLANLVDAVNEIEGEVLYLDHEKQRFISGSSVLRGDSGYGVTQLVAKLVPRVIRLELNAIDHWHQQTLDTGIYDALVKLAAEEGRESGKDTDGMTYVHDTDVEAVLNDHPKLRQVLAGMAKEWGVSVNGHFGKDADEIA